MNAIGLLRRLGPADLRNIRRDPILLWALVMPPCIAALLRWGVPALGESLRTRFGFDLTPYHPLIAGGYLLIAPSVVGFVGGFLLLDERDDRILDAIRVTPVPMSSLLTYRLGVPLIAGSVITVAGYSFIGVAGLALSQLIVAAALAACSGPILALLLIGFADNKVSGFAMAKLFSALSNVALIAWFVPMPWQLMAGLVPSYWPMKIVWQAAADAAWVEYAVAGLAVNVIAAWLLLRRFRAVFSR
jgi:fluoroquinolone transport system permease protein